MRNIIVVLFFLTLAACGGVENTSEAHLAKAKTFLAEEDYASARIELQNALQLDGSSAEARWLLGKIYLDSGDVLTAEKELQRARELGWKKDDIRPALAQALLGQGRFDDVLTLDYNDLSAPAASELLGSQAMAELSAGKVEKASELVDLALEKAPDSLEVKVAEATVLLYEGNTERALTVIESVLKQMPESGKAWRLKGQALLRQQNWEEALLAFDNAIAYSNIVFADRVARALINMQLQNHEEAQAEVDELLPLAPDNPTVNYIQGLLYFQNNEYRNAITALSKAEPVAREFPLTFYYLGLAYLTEKDISLAANFAGKFVSLSPGNISGRRLYAIILVLQDKITEAREVIRPVIDNNPEDVQALNILANALLLDDQAYAGMVLYARIVQLQPDWPIAPLRLEAEIVDPDSNSITDRFSRPMPEGKSNFPQTEILTILGHLGQKDFPAAIEAAKSYQFRDLESLAPYQVLARVYLAAGQPDEAREVLDKILKREPTNAFANLNLALLALQADDQDTAREYYKTVLQGNQNDLRALLQLAALESRNNDEQAMLALLKRAMEAHPAILDPRMAMARYYLATGRPEKVEPLFDSLEPLQRQASGVLEMTGLAQLEQRQFDDALVTLRQLVESKPESARAHYLLARAANSVGDAETTRQELEIALQLDENNVPALLIMARIEARDRNAEQLEQHLAKLEELTPDSPEVLKLQALAEQMKGNTAEALAFSKRAFELSPTTQYLIELAAYQKAAGNDADARASLQNWIKSNPSDITVRLALASDLELEKKVAGAQTQYLAVIKLDPDNVSALNNLAWNLRYKDPAGALEYIRRAAGAAPDVPAVLDTLAVVEHLNGDNESARKNIQRARAGAPANLSMRYHEAMIEAALGETGKAVAILEELLVEGGGEFPERVDAKELLRTLKS